MWLEDHDIVSDRIKEFDEIYYRKNDKFFLKLINSKIDLSFNKIFLCSFKALDGDPGEVKKIIDRPKSMSEINSQFECYRLLCEELKNKKGINYEIY